MATSNAIHRTFYIKWGESIGTAFAIDHASKQYLVTAYHVVKGIEPGDAIEIRYQRKWESLPVSIVGIEKGGIDVAVFACQVRLAPSHPLVASNKGLQLGQQVSFLGFPFGWDGGGEHLNRGYPLPFVKAGIVSMLDSRDVPYTYLDAHGNRGFSGGPVVFSPNGQPGKELRVAGIISRLPPYPDWAWSQIIDSEGKPITDATGEPIAYIRENPGIVVVIPIGHAVALIDANPIGFQLPAEEKSQAGGQVLQK